MKKLLALVFFTVALSSCSSDSGSDSASATGILLQKIVREGPSGNQTTTYVYNGNKMNTISYGPLVLQFYYTGNLVTKFEAYNSGHLMSVFTFDYNGSEKIVQSITASPDIDLVERDTLVYNNDNTISVNHYSAFEGGLETLQARKYFLDADGEIIKIEKYNSSDTATTFYTYDTKCNPYKDVIGFDKLLNYVSHGIRHNRLTTHETNFDGSVILLEKTITYNAQDYPITVLYTGGDVEHYYY